MVSLLVYGCMESACDYLVMRGHWHGGFPGFKILYPFLAISWIVIVLWFFQLDNFLIGAHNSLWLWVGTNTLEALEHLDLSY